jgi:nucleotidyltransferase substrate binding protein (TIGR01987 family)
MREETFNLTAFENATKRLGEILVRYQKDVTDDGIRDSVIQRFEFTYSIALKTLSKFLIMHSFTSYDVNQMSFNDIIRTANQLGLLKSNLEQWTVFRNMRNLTSHTYDENVAKQVVSVVPEFYKEVCFLLESLKEKWDA